MEKGEVLFAPEESGDKIYVLKEGRVEIYRLGPDGRELTLEIVGESTIFGDLALGFERPQTAYARALEPSLVGEIDREDLENLVRHNPEVSLQLVRLLNDRLRFCRDRVTGLARKNVAARLASLILSLIESEGVKTREGYRVPVRYTHQQLGAMIGVKRVAVSRAFRKLREAGAVEYTRRYVEVRNLHVLERVAQEAR